MTEFIQLHLLTSYPPSNLNRDDLGRPKTAVMGGAQRLRISSQSLKRAWRTSDLFKQALDGHVGTRTREMGKRVFRRLTDAGMGEKKARACAEAIAQVFGKPDSKEPLLIRQLAHFSPEEIQAIDELADRLAEESREPEEEEVKLLQRRHRAADIALFGRMLADEPGYNVEAAAQVAHAITVHRVAVENDFFTAVDDLNERQEDVGAGHLGETEFAAGLFYLYLCIDCDRLVENLSDDEDLGAATLRALVEAATRVSPSGKQNSFASRAYASYVLAERGDKQPRSLSVAFLKPVKGEDFLARAIEGLEKTRADFETSYGESARTRYRLDAHAGKGTLAELLDFISAPLPAES